MEKHNYDAGLPATNAPFNLCVRHGDLIFISGLPPFDETFSRAVREAREQGRAIPPFPNPPFAEQARLVMDNMKRLVEAAGSNMDCLLKVIVWLRDQRDAEEFDRIYRTYFSGRETLPARTRIQAGRTRPPRRAGARRAARREENRTSPQSRSQQRRESWGSVL
jgi:2-iminobutanoate/2-iminopropanoate deaminase